MRIIRSIYGWGLTVLLLLAAGCGPDVEAQCLSFGLQQELADTSQAIRARLTRLRIEIPDTAFRQPPLRPSEKAWYDEHCWQLRPRP